MCLSRISSSTCCLTSHREQCSGALWGDTTECHGVTRQVFIWKLQEPDHPIEVPIEISQHALPRSLPACNTSLMISFWTISFSMNCVFDIYILSLKISHVFFIIILLIYIWKIYCLFILHNPRHHMYFILLCFMTCLYIYMYIIWYWECWKDNPIHIYTTVKNIPIYLMYTWSIIPWSNKK